MTNETTASQPTPHQNTLDAITGAIAYGRQGTNPPPSPDHWLAEYWAIGQQLAELGKTSAWDNVTPTASQPKSIGDDAMREVIQDAVADNMTSLYLCGRHQSAWGAGTMGLDDFSPAGDSDNVITNITDAVMSAIHKEIEFRAPAAQASATIQAAPVVTGQQAIQALTAAMNHAEINVDQRAHLLGFFSNEWNKCLATIQEPVMVAEPVGDTQAQAIFPPKFPKFMPDFYKGISREDIWQDACFTGWRCADAAPMVADPAGVAVGEVVLFGGDLKEVAWAKGKMPEPGTKLYAAATVKAVPSEALSGVEKYEVLHADQGMWYEVPKEQWERCNREYRRPRDAAPLADKTGGGE